MSYINKAIKRSYAPVRRRKVNEPLDTYTILLHQGGSIISGLTVDEGKDGLRNLLVLPGEYRKGSLGELVSEGGISFVTRQGKKWIIRFSEFSFVINGREERQAT